MNEWLRPFSQWDWSVFWPEVLGKGVGVGLGIFFSWFLLIRKRLQAMHRLLSGDSDDLLFQAHYLLPIANHRVQLLFRNVAEKKTVPQIYDNPAAAQKIRDWANTTTLNSPILPTQETIGFEILNDAAGWISGSLATSPSNRDVWLFCLTAEDRSVVRKRCIRGLLIRPEQLKLFHDWNWCQEKVTVERPWHWFRIVALHRIARYWADQCRVFSEPIDPSTMPLVDDQCAHRRLVPLSLGVASHEQPIGPPVVIEWKGPLETLAAKGLILEQGSWPMELVSSG